MLGPLPGGDFQVRDDEGGLRSIPFVLPGELVELSESSPAILEPSPERVVPRCQHFGRCGGCQYQHASYPEQLRWKLDLLRDAARRAGVELPPGIPVHAAEPWAYRNRIRLRIQAENSAGGELRVGYSRRASHEFLPISECPIAAPLLLQAAEALLALAAAEPATARLLARVAELELFCDAAGERLGLTLISHANPGATRPAELSRACEALHGKISQLTGAGWVLLPGGRAGARPRPLAGWGAAGIPYAAAGGSYWISRGGFFQVNRWLVDELVELVTGGRTDAAAWDLFAGVGLFSRVLAGKFGTVTAVEASAAASADLRRAMARLGGHRVVAAPVLDFLRTAVLDRDRPDLVVLDPPRAGAGAAVCDLLLRVAAPAIVYVSCNPEALFRDLRVMLDAGYSLAALHLVDLFPQTSHAEAVAVLERRHGRQSG